MSDERGIGKSKRASGVMFGNYGITDLFIYAYNLTREQYEQVRDNYDVNAWTPNEDGVPHAFKLYDADDLDEILTLLRTFDVRHEVEQWKRWPTSWVPDGNNTARVHGTLIDDAED